MVPNTPNQQQQQQDLQQRRHQQQQQQGQQGAAINTTGHVQPRQIPAMPSALMMPPPDVASLQAAFGGSIMTPVSPTDFASSGYATTHASSFQTTSTGGGGVANVTPPDSAAAATAYPSNPQAYQPHLQTDLSRHRIPTPMQEDTQQTHPVQQQQQQTHIPPPPPSADNTMDVDRQAQQQQHQQQQLPGVAPANAPMAAPEDEDAKQERKCTLEARNLLERCIRRCPQLNRYRLKLLLGYGTFGIAVEAIELVPSAESPKV
jgi:hypothetical protein